MKNHLFENFLTALRDRNPSFLNEHATVDKQGTYFVKPTWGFSPESPLTKESCIRLQYESIVHTFGIEQTELNEQKFNEAVSGGGNEWLEISQLNSSTLLAFLCFHDISDQKFLNIPGIGKFSDVFFEVKSNLPPYKRSRPKSHMDIVLTNDKQALFLESKFTEYGKTRTSLTVSNYYDKYYEDLFNHKTIDGLTYNPEEHLWLAPDGAYIDGFKQMICHYLGLKNCLLGNRTINAWKVRNGADLSQKEIILGEIVYVLDENEQTFNNYKRLHEELVDSLPKGNCPHVLRNLLTYQDVFKGFPLAESIRKFYMLPY